MKMYVYSTFWSCSEGDNFSKIVVVEENRADADKLAYEEAEKNEVQIIENKGFEVKEYEIKRGLVA